MFSWLEDGIAIDDTWGALRYFCETILKLALIKALGNRIIWIKHNYVPHQLEQSSWLSRHLFHSFTYLIKKLSDKKLAHSQRFCERNPEFEYIPHPLYKIENPSLTTTKSVKYFIFGRLMRYKRTVELLKVWPKHVMLNIKGKPEDAAYGEELTTVISERSLNVTIDPQYLDSEFLEKSLQESETVIVTNTENSMIVSGVIIHALSFGCNVLSSRNAFATELEENGLSVKTFESMEALINIITTPNTDSESKSKTSPAEYFSEITILSVLRAVLKN